MLRLNVVRTKSTLFRYPISGRRSISKPSCKIPKNAAESSRVISLPTYNRTSIRLFSDKTSKPTNAVKKEPEEEEEEALIEEEEEGPIGEEDEAPIEDEDDFLDYLEESLQKEPIDEKELEEDLDTHDESQKQFLKDVGIDEADLEDEPPLYVEPNEFDDYVKPYDPALDGYPEISRDPLVVDLNPPDSYIDPKIALPLDEMVHKIEAESRGEKYEMKLPTEEEFQKMEEEEEKEPTEEPPISDEEQELLQSLEEDWPGWEKEFVGPPNRKFQKMMFDLLDFLNEEQTVAYSNTDKSNEEYARLSKYMETMEGKYEEWKQRRKQFEQFVQKHRQSTHFGVPSARVRFSRASGIGLSAVNPDLGVSLRADWQPQVISTPPPFHGGGCKHITINKPAQYNPLNLEAVVHLADLFKKWNENSEVYSVCLKGNGPAFIGGFDLKEMANSDNHVKRQYTYHLYSLMRTLAGIRKFYVPIANGVIGGPGVAMFMFGSAPYVTENAVMTVTDSAAGMYPLGTFEALNTIFPKWFSKFLLMTGYPITAGHWSMMKGSYIPLSRVPDLERRLSEVLSSKSERFKQALNEVEECTFLTPDRIDDAGAFLSTKLELIGKAFNHTSVSKILEYLDAQNDTFASDLAQRMRQRSPLSLLLIQLRFNIETKRQQFHKYRLDQIEAEVEAARLAAEQVTPENVKAFLATLPVDVFGSGLVAMYDTACKATEQMKPLLNTIVPGRELTDEGVAKLKEGIDTRMKGVAFSVHDYIKAVWEKHSRPFLLSPEGATVYPWDPEYPKILYCMKPAEEREKLIKIWHENQAEIVEKLKNPKNRDPNELLFSEEGEALPGYNEGIVLPEGGAFNWFAEEAVRQHNDIILRTVPEDFWDDMVQKVYYHKPGEKFDPEKVYAKGGVIPGAEAKDYSEEGEDGKKDEITTEEKISAEIQRHANELVRIRQMEARAFYRLSISPEFSAAVNSLLHKSPAPQWKPLEEYDFKTVLSYFMPGPDTAELDAAIGSLDSEPLPDIMEWRRAKKYRPYWNRATTVDMDAEEAL